MIELYDDEQEVLRSYVESEIYEAALEIAKRILKMGKLTIEEIAAGSGLTVEEVEDLVNMQLV